MRTTSRDPFLYGGSRRARHFPRAAFVLILLFFLALFFWRGTVEGFLWKIAAPFFEASLGGNSQVVSLQGQLAQAQAELVDRNALYEENLLLKNQLGRPDAERQVILAAVLLAPPATPYDTFVIDAGSNEGIRLGELVSAGGNALIGTISEVYDTTARVELFSAPGKTYTGYLHGNVAIPMQGQGAGSLSAEVPSATPVAIGDEVVFPGIAGGISEIVSGIDAPQGDSFKTVYFHLPVSISSVRLVDIWQSGQ